jgi:predicted GIY-YIG superfamily endonuclease
MKRTKRHYRKRFSITKEYCQQEALKYKTKKEFNENDSGVYTTAAKSGWLDEICSHMTVLRKPKGFWTKENCKIEALKYESKKEFEENASYVYETCLKNGWIKELCSHMKNEESRLLLNRLVYTYIFPDNHIYVGLTYDIIRRKNQHKNCEESAVYQHIQKTGLEPKVICSEYMPAEQAQKEEEKTVKKYKKKGYIILNIANTGALGGTAVYWTFEKCEEEAKKYKTMSDFQRESNGAYDACYKKGWLDKIRVHMIEKKKPSGYWTKKRCLEEAKKYSSSLEMDQNSPGAYKAAKQGKFLKELTANFKKN